jgi:hypothetical protein
MERKDRYIMASNPLPKFIEESCVVSNDRYSRYSELYNQYVNYLKQHNRRIISKLEFSKILTQEGYEVRKTTREGQTDRWIEGVGLKNIEQQDKNAPYASNTSNLPPASYIGNRGKNTVFGEYGAFIHAYCSICHESPCIGYDKTGKPLCETCYGAKMANNEMVE